jgi:hypothetical protein
VIISICFLAHSEIRFFFEGAEALPLEDTQDKSQIEDKGGQSEHADETLKKRKGGKKETAKKASTAAESASGDKKDK